MSAHAAPAEATGDVLDSVFALKLPPRPYPGLRPFEKSEWPIFFGRERMADAIVKQLVDRHLLVIHGDSGCGKSSLVRAAVLPRLEQYSARGALRWRTCTVLPRGGPLRNIAKALAVLDAEGGEPDPKRVMDIRRVLNFGRQAPQALAQLVCADEREHVCILIDQFEELFEQARRSGPEEAQMLVDFLIGLAEAPPRGLYVAVTMRSEFMGACARFRGFAEVVNATQYLLPRISHDDMVRAICEPATMYGGRVSSEMAEWLIADAGDIPDQLPLIQHALMLMHRECIDAMALAAPEGDAPQPAAWVLDIREGQQPTGLAQRLSDHADAVADEVDATLGADALKARLIEYLMRELTDINADGNAIRRPRTLRQLMDATRGDETDLRTIIYRFRADGTSFLQPDPSVPITEDSLIDIGHEALIRYWQRIDEDKDGWLIREFRNGLVWRSLLVQTDSFKRDPLSLLNAATLKERLTWMRPRNQHWAERYGGRWDEVRDLLAASAADIDQQDAERAAQEESRVKEEAAAANMRALARRLRWGGVAGIILLALTVSVWYQRDRAQDEAAQARQATERAKAAAGRALAAEVKARASASEARAAVATAQDTVDALRYALDRIQAVSNSKAAVDANIRDARVELQVQQSKLQVAPRVYFHIADESQRDAARSLELALENATIDASQAKIVVPGIQLVKTGPPRSVLRCFRAQDCKTDAPRLIEQINQRLDEPRVVLDDMSAKYETSSAIRDRHFELWLAPGTVSLRKR